MASFEKFEPIFGEIVPERSDPGSGLLRRCLFHVYASDSFHLTVHVTDFVSGAWTTILSVSKLDDMRDTVGIGGSWAEFVDYTIASLKSENVKLVLGENSASNGARLVSQKAKGMPRIIVPLTKMVDSSSASEAMANLSLELFRAFKSKKHLQGEVSSSAATIDEKDKNDATYKQLDVMAPSSDNRLDSPAKKPDREANTTKPAKRVPAHRRTRKRGALLQDSEEEEG